MIPGHSRLSQLEEQRALFDGVLSEKPLGWSGPTWVISRSRRPPAQTVTFHQLADDATIELFTSGSTGQPKRVIKSLAVLDREAELLATHFADRLAGCRIVASVAPQLISSPAFLKRLDPRLTPPPVAILFSAGGVLPWEQVTGAADWFKCWPDEIYGSTETGILAWRCREQEYGDWRPFPGVKLLPEGEAFRVFSPLIAERDGLLLDDTLQLTADGHFRLTGRRGRVVKIEEKRISLSEIEQRLMELEGIRDAVALPVSRGGRPAIGVLLVLTDHTRQQWLSASKPLEQAWRRALRPTLEPVAIPRYWRSIDEIPVNSMNKRVYAQLQELFHETP